MTEEDMTLTNKSDKTIVISPGDKVKVDASYLKFGGMNRTVVKDVK